MQWHAPNPDLNPIENIWASLKKRLVRYDTAQNNIEELYIYPWIISRNMLILLATAEEKKISLKWADVQGVIQKFEYVSNCALSSGTICLKILPFDCLSFCHVVLNFLDVEKLR